MAGTKLNSGHMSVIRAAAALALAAGTAQAATFTFTNTLSNGLWFSEAQSAGTWFNNWGQSGAAAGLPTPGVADTANLVGAVNGNGNISVQVLNNPSTGSFVLTGATLDAGTFTNNGTFGFNGGSKTFGGTWANTASGTINWGDGAGWSMNLTTLTLNNAGLVNLIVGLNANNGALSNTGVVNKINGGTANLNSTLVANNAGGSIQATNGSLIFNTATTSSNPSATWVTAAAGGMRLSNSTFIGTYAGNFDGLGAVGGTMTLNGATTFTNVGAGTQPWTRESGTINTGAFSLTNTGGVLTAAGNQAFIGTFVNQGTVTLAGSGWNYNLNGSLASSGTLNLPAGSSVTGISVAGAVVNNTGAINKNAGGISTWNALSFNHNAGSINASSGGLVINNSAIASGPAANWNTTLGGGVTLNGTTVTGTFTGTATGDLTMTNPSFIGNTLLNATGGNGWDVYGSISTGAFTLTNNATASLARGGGNVGLIGTIVNSVGANMTMSNGAGWGLNLDGGTLTNNGLMVVPSQYSISKGTNAATFTNNGTLSRTAGGGLTVSNVAVTNNGSLVHDVNGSGTTFNAGTYVSGPSSSYTIPSGGIAFNGVALRGSFVANFTGGGGAAMNNPTFTAASTLNATGGDWNLTGTVGTTAGAVLNNGRAGFGIVGGNTVLLGSVTNSNGANWTMSSGAGWVLMLEGGTFNNNAGGTVLIPGGYNINKGTGSATFVNNGAISRTLGGSTVFNSVAFTHNGTLTHDVNGSGTTFNTGTYAGGNASAFTIASGGLQFNSMGMSGRINANLAGGGAGMANSTLTGALTLNTTGGAMNLTGTTNTGAFTLTNIAMAGSAIGGGNSTLIGNFVNAPGATWTFGSGAGWITGMEGATFTNNGSLFIPAGHNLAKGTGAASLVNTGTITMNAGGTKAFNTITIANSGLMTTLGGASTVFNSCPITQTGGGVIRTTAGTGTTFNTSTINGGRFEGAGQWATNNNFTPTNLTIAPGDTTSSAVAEMILNSGSLTFGAGSRLEVDIDRPVATQIADKLRTNIFNQNINLNDATLVVRRPTAGYTPSFNVEHVIVETLGGGSLTGTFGSVVEANPLATYGYRVRYTASQAIMKVVRQCNVSDVAGPGQVQLFDGEATADDLVVFIGWFTSGDMRADFATPGPLPGQDGELTADDIILFVNLFTQGCGF